MATVGLVQRFAPRIAAGTFDTDPGVRALGLALLIVGWLLSVSSTFAATGTRRLLGRAASIGCYIASVARLAGPAILQDVDTALPLRDAPGARAFVGAAVLTACAAFVFLTSPARRRGK